jgi:antitoxin (DNA-binding transcriptional repressor) of toxin-antitoxin stability system
MTIVTIHEAKTHLSRLIKDVLAGQEVTIAQGRTGEKLVTLVPAMPKMKPKRIAGWLAHQKPPGSKGILENGFWDALSDEEMGLGPDALLDQK